MAKREFEDERYPGIVISEDQLRKEYEASDEAEEVNFVQWLNNCMQYNNGTLFEVKR